jgi:hypothetical protein
MLEYFIPGYNHARRGWVWGRRLPVARLKMEDEEVMAMCPEDRVIQRAMPASAEYSFILTMRQPIFNDEFMKNVINARSHEDRINYLNNLYKNEYVEWE